MQSLQHAFLASTEWTMAHPWGTIHPAPVVTDTEGHTWLVAPDYGDGTITISFSEPLAGILTLFGPNDGETEIILPPPLLAAATAPFSNSILAAVNTPGVPDKSGDVDQPGDPMWVGQAPGYLKRPRRTTLSAGQQIDVKQDILYLPIRPGVPTKVGPGAQWNGATVVIDDLRGAAAVRKRFTVKHEDLRAVGSDVDSLRLELSYETDL